MRSSIRVLVASSTLAAAVVAATAAPAQAGGLIVIDHGHVDVVGVAVEDGNLHLHVHDESVEPDVEREPEDVRFRVLPAAATSVPTDPAYAFLGAAGDPVWILPQTQDPDLIWAGLGTEEIDAGVLRADTVNVTFAVLGPGDVAVYTENAFGLPADILVDTGDGQPDTFALPTGDHLHANWAFEEPGTYRITVAVTGRLAATGRPVADAGLYRFEVQA
ncbi:choice-of-anchor M domain-containing protein [Asanoa sp. WMMD1127]|uniref:choice-of-anchor M domain-containing protein n=1 Tax=Asanoa sp. WMMD1127 TaxID=3016107 RepID=UPI00241811DF|nr:choice-of-anchor M domain-containing protein [Asanoa sp. WMMD1127]MDG4820504.1 choice-of-anchor M domain-containing protein [Asanoa sp. WMMD1127]